MNVFFTGFETKEATFKTTSTVLEKKAVALTGTGEVYYPAKGAPFTGIVASYRDGIASVIMSGYAVATFKDTIPTVGICKLSTGTAGNLEVDEENGTPYTVVGVDISDNTFEFIL